jgi:PilZ domain
MYEAYFTRRLLEALTLAEQATNAKERSTHIRASRYYRDLLQWPEQRRSVRHSVRIGALLHHFASSPRPVIVSDVSSHGFRVELDEKATPGTIVALQMEGLVPIEAYVVWQDGSKVGCRFLAELHPALLEAAVAVSPRVQ